MTKQTGFTPAQVAGTLLRDGGVCSMWGADKRCRRNATTANHRQNRGQGGTSDRGTGRNGMANACAICDWCNGAIEDGAELAEEARRRGVKLDGGRKGNEIRMWSPWFGQWVHLTDESLTLTGITNPALDARRDDIR